MTRETREVIAMLREIKRQSLRSCNDTAVLDINLDSFNFVIDEAIKWLSGGYTSKEICSILINEGQNHSMKYGFKLGDVIRFTPTEVEEILKADKESDNNADSN